MNDDSRIQESVKIARLRDEQKKEELRHVLLTKQGRAALWSILEQCGFFRLSFSGNDHSHSDFKEGQRSVALWLITEIDSVSEMAYVTMQQEAIVRNAQYRPVGVKEEDE